MTNAFGINKRLAGKAQAEVGTADTPVLREADAGPRKELGGFNLTDRRIDQLTKLPTLLVGNGSE
jgi:hypothetical protein